MKKQLFGIVFAVVAFMGFQSSAKAVFVSFDSTDVTNTNDYSAQIGEMRGVALRNGEMDLIITDTNSSDGIDPNNMTRDGYDFTGWVEHQPTPNGNVLTIDNVNRKISYSADNDGTPRHVYATWTPTQYAINYNLVNGSVSGNPSSYTIEDNDITLNNPTRDGYEFAGWQDENGTDLGMTVTIAQGSIGDKTYIATWKKLELAATNNPATADNISLYMLLLSISASGLIFRKKLLANN